jgi:hypothetical protein
LVEIESLVVQRYLTTLQHKMKAVQRILEDEDVRRLLLSCPDRLRGQAK